jgi:CHAT domain-containing protein
MRRQLRDQYDSTVQQSMESGELLATLAQQRGPAIAAHDAYQELKASELTRQMQILDEKIAAHRHPAIAWRDGVTDHRLIPGDLVGDQTLLVSYYSIRGRLHVLTVKNGLQDSQAHPLQVGVSELETQLQRTNRLISRPDSSLWDVQTHLGHLWTSLIAPIESRLSDCEHIIILPYRGLFRVPFSALFDLRAKQYLIERWSVQTAPSVAVLAHCRKRSRGTAPPLLIGFPGDPSDADYLPGVIKEVHLLHGAVKHADVLLAEQATPDQVMAQISGRSLIHLACHAIFDQHDPLMSGLRLANGRWLRAADLYQHYGVIEGSAVVLSGCSTSQGRPTGQDILGMVSALLYAGASCVVAGLWRIDDAATVELMKALYDGLTHTGSVVSSLQQAQRTLLLSSIHSHPYFWAPFVSTGDATRPLSRTHD